MSLSEMYVAGGPFTIAVTIWGLGLWAMVAIELLDKGRPTGRRSRRPLMRGGLAGMLLVGVLATALGIVEGMRHIAALGAHPPPELLPHVLAIAPTPVVLATLLAIPVALGIGAAEGRRNV